MKERIFGRNAVLFLLLFIGSCVSTGEKKEIIVEKSDNKEVNAMISRIEAINKNAVKTYSASFEVDGAVKKKKFKSIGRASFDRTAGKMYISFLDYIFKSPVTKVYINGKEIIFYFPVDKKLVKDNAATINLRNYNNIDIDYPIIYDLLTGVIPLIKNYSVKQGLAKSDGNKSYLILENDKTYQTISFYKNYPDRIKLVRKKNKRICEIYLKKRMSQDNGYFFRRIVMIEKAADVRIALTFKSLKLNSPVKVKTVKDLKLPRDAKIISM